ncbi:MAG: DUF4266 domain-containing protein [Deltaproteobacteria bacterium]|nr:DUF4266 domain-containing protein [Deltaproteobacteria bacterium]
MTALGLVVLVCAAATGCVRPVPSWARGPLAHPTMVADDVATGLDGHVRAVSEGATGSLGGAGGGCGCN